MPYLSRSRSSVTMERCAPADSPPLARRVFFFNDTATTEIYTGWYTLSLHDALPICRSDIHSYEGRRPNPCPGILGHEIIGVIEEIGAGIEKDMRGDPLNVGDRITWSEYFFHGDCYYREVLDMPQKCHGVRKYGHDLAEQDPHFLGGFAEYCYILPGTWILKLPDVLSDEEATPLNCGVATMASVTEAAEIALGDAVVVQGLGLLGLYGCAMAKARGARLVIGLDAVPGRLEVAKKFGADHTFNIKDMSDKEIVAKVRDLCKPD